MTVCLDDEEQILCKSIYVGDSNIALLNEKKDRRRSIKVFFVKHSFGKSYHTKEKRLVQNGSTRFLATFPWKLEL